MTIPFQTKIKWTVIIECWLPTWPPPNHFGPNATSHTLPDQLRCLSRQTNLNQGKTGKSLKKRSKDRAQLFGPKFNSLTYKLVVYNSWQIRKRRSSTYWTSSSREISLKPAQLRAILQSRWAALKSWKWHSNISRMGLARSQSLKRSIKN